MDQRPEAVEFFGIEANKPNCSSKTPWTSAKLSGGLEGISLVLRRYVVKFLRNKIHQPKRRTPKDTKPKNETARQERYIDYYFYYSINCEIRLCVPRYVFVIS